MARFRPPASASRSPPAPAAGQVRIVGGRWRNTRLAIGDVVGLRPTGERVRETLFNWLMPVLPGARVLDLFAGSGALGLESVSRGAASAVLVEREPGQAARLREAVARLEAGGQVDVVQDDALRWLAGAPPAAFDIAFLDPPFAAGLLPQGVPALVPHLAPRAWVYVEAPEAVADIPPGWTEHRRMRTRETCCTLYRVG
ncbi:16S rRNA (guanine(966)-N(2))-methyltransferase RsmD [Xanthomonas massiliensis]|uniref:16S rRNA (guanine(966)-N(2))-methyltransferase RsmD n=1 Tax=Xanthomonas massiliensis TaxID=1720302 RepID=UPI0008263F2D|nr:16S rRNA (guanine(966)-N(2))-methyltransferase RsmD [Xanthomonas massiliensis]